MRILKATGISLTLLAVTLGALSTYVWHQTGPDKVFALEREAISTLRDQEVSSLQSLHATLLWVASTWRAEGSLAAPVALSLGYNEELANLKGYPASGRTTQDLIVSCQGGNQVRYFLGTVKGVVPALMGFNGTGLAESEDEMKAVDTGVGHFAYYESFEGAETGITVMGTRNLWDLRWLNPTVHEPKGTPPKVPATACKDFDETKTSTALQRMVQAHAAGDAQWEWLSPGGQRAVFSLKKDSGPSGGTRYTLEGPMPALASTYDELFSDIAAQTGSGPLFSTVSLKERDDWTSGPKEVRTFTYESVQGNQFGATLVRPLTGPARLDLAHGPAQKEK